MNDSVVKQFSGRLASANSAPEESDGAEDYGAFAILRGVRDFARFLQLRMKDGSMIAIGYAWLERVEFQPPSITLHFTTQRVTIIGRNLNSEIRPNVRLLDGLLRHRVPWLQQADAATVMEADHRATVIESVEVVSI